MEGGELALGVFICVLYLLACVVGSRQGGGLGVWLRRAFATGREDLLYADVCKSRGEVVRQLHLLLLAVSRHRRR